MLAFGFPDLFRLALPAVEVVEASVQMASASMDAQAVLDEAQIEEEEMSTTCQHLGVSQHRQLKPSCLHSVVFGISLMLSCIIISTLI